MQITKLSQYLYHISSFILKIKKSIILIKKGKKKFYQKEFFIRKLVVVY
ncbi:hypothetical protein LCGC14_1562720 [marine sediment metagenome]|uniref:Uncharacterized protein n=1 Tax=marine sediment metagenome TaxID=412755 RepID=A0A0F9J852_9ZZZZ